MKRELPILDESRCSGCGDCVFICPTGCIESMKNRVWIPRPRDCIHCEACVVICPEMALKIVPWIPA